MEILEKIDWKTLNTYIDNNLININKHPEYDIWILNYSVKTQAQNLWDLYTESCRGLVIDSNGNILARPFKKFRNYEEYDPSEIDMSKPFEIFEKMDGSLIILFYYEAKSEWIVASRGSFISEQAIEAKKMLDEKNVYNTFHKNCTCLFEVIYPENRICVNYYNLRDLILLTIIENKSGNEFPYSIISNDYYTKYFTVVKKYDIKVKNLLDLKKLEEDNKEGFVVRFSDGFRIIIDFEEYLRLHKILTNVSNLSVWECLRTNNYDMNLLYEKTPDEFYKWLTKTISSLESKFNEIERIALKEFIRIYYINNIVDRKEFAAEAKKHENYKILFNIYNKKSYDDIIWKEIRPVFSKPFKNGNEYIP